MEHIGLEQLERSSGLCIDEPGLVLKVLLGEHGLKIAACATEGPQEAWSIIFQIGHGLPTGGQISEVVVAGTQQVEVDIHMCR
jgi:hypothetical protein